MEDSIDDSLTEGSKKFSDNFICFTGVPAQVPPPTEQGSQWKGLLPPQGQVPGSTSQPVDARFGINGFSATQNTQPPPPPSGTGAQGQMFMNGPSVGQPSHFNLTNRPPRPAVLQNPGQFQPSQPPSAVGLNRPPVMPSFVQPGQPGSTGPTPSHFGHPGQSASDSTSEGKTIARSLVRVRTKILIFFFLNQNICCGYSKEPSQRDCSFEHPKHVLKLMGK